MTKPFKLILFFVLMLLISQLSFLSGFAAENETTYLETSANGHDDASRAQEILGTLLEPEDFHVETLNSIINNETKTELLITLNERVPESRAALANSLLLNKLKASIDQGNKVTLIHQPKTHAESSFSFLNFLASIFVSFIAFMGLVTLFQRQKNRRRQTVQIDDWVNTIKHKVESIPLPSVQPVLEALPHNPPSVQTFMRNLSAEREEALFHSLETHYPEEAELLRKSQVVFKDIPVYRPGLIRETLKKIDAELLKDALSGMPPQFVYSFLNYAPIQNAIMVMNELNQQKPKPALAQSADARRKICLAIENEMRTENSKQGTKPATL